MKIGIVTFWWTNDNYGQVLQLFALQKFLRDAGHDAFLIKYTPQTDLVKKPFYKKIYKLFNPISLYNFFYYKVIDRKRLKIVNTENLLNDRGFEEFRSKYIKATINTYSSFDELRNNPPRADIYIVGSDQVFNYNLYSMNALNVFFLNFGDSNIKRMSYAASWGLSSIEEKYKTQIEPLLKKFDYVSVREEDGITLCKECGIDNAEWVVDPTMLLGPNIYRDLYSKKEIKKEKPYILLYMLNNECDFDIEVVYNFAIRKGLEVIYITGNGVVDNRKKRYASIEEWLYLIDHAEYVISNSFHCGVFSTLFHKQYALIKLAGKWSKMNSRLDSLFRRFNINERYVLDKDLSILDEEYTTNFSFISSLLRRIESYE